MGTVMQDAAFDQARADALIQEIGGEIARGSKFAANPWEKISVVANLDRQKRLYGYCYWGARDWEAATPDGFAALGLFGDLQEAMKVPGQDAWKKALLRIDRASGKVDIDFDYDGNKWVPDPSDPEGFAFSIR